MFKSLGYGYPVTVGIGSVSSGATPSVTNTGTPWRAILNFILPKGDTGPQGPKGDTGAAGTSPTLSNATPQALGTAAAGSGTNASRDDHVHPKQVVLVGNVTVTETLLVSLNAGTRRMNVALTGITAADNGKLIAVPNGLPTTGCEMINAYPNGTNSVSVGYYTPLLGIGATYTIPVSIYRIV